MQAARNTQDIGFSHHRFVSLCVIYNITLTDILCQGHCIQLLGTGSELSL